MKTRTGYVFKKGKRWVARVTYTDESGRRRDIARYCKTKTEAMLARSKLLRQLEERGEKAIEGDKMTFAAAADRFEQLKLIPAQYVGDVKVAGLRSLNPKIYLKVLKSHFGSRRLRAITHADIEAFKLKRLATPIKQGKGENATERPRAVASVNRELELLRAIFNFAKRQRWISVSPFAEGEPLIIKAAEKSRERVLSFDEEDRLLAVCEGPRAHLRPLVIGALDLGFRRGELFQLEWRDVDLEGRLITLRSVTTKTARSRTVAMTERLNEELSRLWEQSDQKPKTRVFGIRDNIKNSFRTACKKAGIEGLRFHDLRHTFVSRLIGAGVAHAEAMKVSGHATLSMLSRYLNTNIETARRAAEALNRLRDRRAGVAGGLVN